MKEKNQMEANRLHGEDSNGRLAPAVDAVDRPVEETAAAGDSMAVGGAAEAEDLEQRIVEALETVFDPEIPVSIYALGLIYSVVPKDTGHVDVKMTLTSPHCPVAESLPGDVRLAVEKVDGVVGATVDIVWDPPWSPDMMSEAAKLELGMF